MVAVTDTKHVIVQWLIGRQKQLRLNNREFADLLDIPLGTWTPTKCGQKALGVKVARAALRFPEIAPAAVSFLMLGATDRSRSDTDTRDLAS